MTTPLTWSERCDLERIDALDWADREWVPLSYFEIISRTSVGTAEYIIKHRCFLIFSEWADAWVNLK